MQSLSVRVMFLPNELVSTQQELSGSELGVVTVAGILVFACSVGQVDS